MLEKANPQEDDIIEGVHERVKEAIAPLDAGGYFLLDLLENAKTPIQAIGPWLESLQVWGSYNTRDDRVRQSTPRMNSIKKLDTLCSELSTISGELSASPIASEIY